MMNMVTESLEYNTEQLDQRENWMKEEISNTFMKKQQAQVCFSQGKHIIYGLLNI